VTITPHGGKAFVAQHCDQHLETRQLVFDLGMVPIVPAKASRFGK